MDAERTEQLIEAERIARGLVALMQILMEDGRTEIPYPLFALFEMSLERIDSCLLEAQTKGGSEK